MRDVDSGGTIYFTDAEMAAFIGGIKDGEFDSLVSPDQPLPSSPLDVHPEA